ncbi:Imm10 family immunity protein [Staphylospora marina]|uniref:Imm10 family immunity protein n=1 Tax=Staphylospora marina TaxID=2490858 RepID=UPI0019D01A49|nr:Imm10 family immunity protein [Staphylospora marina]
MDEDLEVMMFGLADDPFDTMEYILFERSLEHDEQDIKLGLDRVYVEVGDQSRSSYGGIEEIAIGKNKVTIRVNDVTALHLGTEKTMKVTVSTEYDPDRVKEFLMNMFEREPSVTIRLE